MAEFARCPTCYLLHLDTPEDRREHKAEHVHRDKQIEAVRKQINRFEEAVAALRDEIAGYGKQLEAHPISFEPETISISDYDADDIDVPGEHDDADDDDYVTTSTYADDNVTATIADPTAGEPAESGADVIYPAIDRDDATPTTAAAAIRQIHTIDLA